MHMFIFYVDLYLQVLTSIAYDMYNQIVVTTLDVDQYPAWAGQFVPRNYGRTMIRGMN